jgi:hypothetical protein
MPSHDPERRHEPLGAREVPRVRPPGPRVFADRPRVEWRVEEVPAAAVPAAKGPACLVFHSEAAIRRGVAQGAVPIRGRHTATTTATSAGILVHAPSPPATLGSYSD